MIEELKGKPSDFLAAERTFLAWIRTGLALMGFGFVVARFGLFLRELQLTQPNLPAQTQRYGFSLWLGTALIVLGIIVNVASIWNHLKTIRGLNDGDEGIRRPSKLATGVAALLAAVGLAMAIYLITIRG